MKKSGTRENKRKSLFCIQFIGLIIFALAKFLKERNKKTLNIFLNLHEIKWILRRQSNRKKHKSVH